MADVLLYPLYRVGECVVCSEGAETFSQLIARQQRGGHGRYIQVGLKRDPTSSNSK